MDLDPIPAVKRLQMAISKRKTAVQHASPLVLPNADRLRKHDRGSLHRQARNRVGRQVQRRPRGRLQVLVVHGNENALQLPRGTAGRRVVLRLQKVRDRPASADHSAAKPARRTASPARYPVSTVLRDDHVEVSTLQNGVTEKDPTAASSAELPAVLAEQDGVPHAAVGPDRCAFCE